MEEILARALGEEPGKAAPEEKLVLLSRLLARVAHEIRNPLSSLDIHVQLLEEDLAQAPAEVKEKTAGRFEIIRGELHRLEGVVKHFLSLAGPSALNLEQVDIKSIVKHVCGLLQPEASQRKIEIRWNVAREIPAITADPVKLTQALVNLVINAIQAVGENGRIEVVAGMDEKLERLSITVRDTGPGVPREKLMEIFEPFFTTKPEGSGLGLWVVQQIISAHGGKVFAGDAADGGAIFMVQLPMQRSENG